VVRRLAAAGATVVVGYHRTSRGHRPSRRTCQGPDTGAPSCRLTTPPRSTKPPGWSGSGHGTVDVLVNAAGITRRIAHSDLDALDDETFDLIYAVNVRGTSFWPGLSPQCSGLPGRGAGQHLVLVRHDRQGQQRRLLCVEGRRRHDGQSLARVLAPEVRVIAISPAAVETDFVPGRDREVIAAQARRRPCESSSTPMMSRSRSWEP